MEVIGIVAEWNPFHKGHAALIQHIRTQHPQAMIVSAMSGAFCQRGEAAIVDKWTRTEMALANGVDVVLELPQFAATASLETFAKIGVKTLCQFYPLNALYCGSESGDVTAINEQALYLKNHREAYDVFIQNALKDGLTYAHASQSFLINAGFDSSKQTPNDRLALHYRLALPEAIPLCCFKRTVAHDQAQATQHFASASTIRQLLYQKDGTYRTFLPDATCQFLSDALPLPQHNRLLLPLKVFAISHTPQELAAVAAIKDGWEHRLHSSILQAEHYEQVIALAQTRHYTRGRIQRLLLSLLSPVKTSEMLPCIRLLGASNAGRQLLKSRTLSTPLILNVAKDSAHLPAQSKHHLIEDIKRQNLADFLCNRPITNRDYLEKPRMI